MSHSTATVAGSGLAEVPPHPHREHLVQFYSEDDLLLQSLQRVVGGALGSGDSALIVATEPHRQGLAKRLKWCGIDLQMVQACGRYRELDAATVLSTLNVLPSASDFQAMAQELLFRKDCPAPAEGARLFIFGGIVGMMWERGRFDDAVRFDEMWNGVQASPPFTLLCGYPVRRFHPLQDLKPFTQVCKVHAANISANARVGVVREWQPEDSHSSAAAWRLLYESALRETDYHQLFKKIEAAESAVLLKIEKSSPRSKEQRDLVDALARLLILKRQKLGAA